MFRVTVEETFAAAHALRGYRGKCENVHGHNYRVRVALEGEALNSIGLLYDFKDLKEAIHCVINRLDHRFLNEIPPFDELNPSAENLAKHFYEEITRMLPSVSDSAAASQYPAGASCRVERVTVWEADDTTATYFANGSRGNGAPDPE